MKEKVIAAVVNTEAALKCCLKENTGLFCIENPLYSQLDNIILSIWELADYQIENYPDKQVAIMKKIRGINSFDESRYEVFYLPLTWDGWHS